MATVSGMIDLKSFPKIGVRVPNSLRRRVKQLALDMEVEGVGMDGDDLTMEAIFAVAALKLLSMRRDDQVEAFRSLMPELLDLFVAEAPGADVPHQSKNPAERGGAEDLGDQGRRLPNPPLVPPRPKGKGRTA